MRVSSTKGFTLVELMVAIAIVAILSVVGIVIYTNLMQKARISQAASLADEMRVAVERYYSDMGFYPPDTGRGKDPGLTSALPVDPDNNNQPLNPVPPCSHCPVNWEQLAQERWLGPYIREWPKTTPWGGKYDYNYWSVEASRYGCTVPPGAYIGVQGDYTDQNKIPQSAEQEFIDKKIDLDGCINGESQLVLTRIE